VKLSHEHKDFCWAPLPRALELAGYDEARKMLVAAEKYLTGLKGEGQSETGKLKETPQ
jgi:hypothetical protein